MPRKSKEIIIFERLNAIRVLHEHGFAEAIRVYPDHRRFIEDNKDRARDEVVKMLEDQLYNRKKNIILDVPPLFPLSEMEEIANGNYYMSDQARDVLIAAKAEADRKGIPYDRLWFYIGCFDGQYGFTIKKSKKGQ